MLGDPPLVAAVGKRVVVEREDEEAAARQAGEDAVEGGGGAWPGFSTPTVTTTVIVTAICSAIRTAPVLFWNMARRIGPNSIFVSSPCRYLSCAAGITLQARQVG
jgi:hypothetical protein